MEKDKIYYIQYQTDKRNTAAFKAPDDIYRICEKEGYQRILMPAFPAKKNKLYIKFWLVAVCARKWLRMGSKLPAGSIVIFQHPQPGRRVVLALLDRIRKKGIRFIAIIHDLESLRGGMKGIVGEKEKTSAIGDNEMLKKFDAVICHNEKMKAYLIEKGFDPEKLVCLEIFDYLSDADREQPGKSAEPTIAIAGNLAKVKAGYIPKIHENGQNANLKVNLYGTRYEPETENEKLVYHGAFPPEELAAHLEGDFGLVWDGPEATTCAGNTGEYMKYNNPHKASMYLSAGMPVIIWDQAALAAFVQKNGAGLAVSSLAGLDKTISGLTEDEYREMAAQAGKLSGRLRSGYYTIRAIEQAADLINGSARQAEKAES